MSEEVTIDRGPTKAELFKKKHGYSRKMGELMRKYKCKTPAEYRKVRQKNKRERRKK